MKIMGFRDGHNVVGPMDGEIANLHHEIETIQEASIERGKELDRLTTDLSIDSPTDAEETVLCQETTNDLIKEAARWTAISKLSR